MALPSIQALAAAFPAAHIHAYAGRHSAPVFRTSEHVSRVYLSPDQLSASRMPGLAWNLRTAGHDWIVVLDRSRWLYAAARSAAPARLVTINSQRPETRHEIDVYLDAIRAVGGKIRAVHPVIKLPDESHARATAALAGVDRHFAVLHPGGAENPGTSMIDKRWPPDSYVSLATSLHERGMQIVLTGGPGDTLLCREIAARIRDLNPVVLAGRTDLLTTAAVVKRAQLFVAGDTGMSHIAAALGTPSIVVFGPTNPARYGPRGPRVCVLAPDASRSLADVDLRSIGTSENRPQTGEISARHVLDAWEALAENETS